MRENRERKRESQCRVGGGRRQESLEKDRDLKGRCKRSQGRPFPFLCEAPLSSTFLMPLCTVTELVGEGRRGGGVATSGAARGEGKKEKKRGGERKKKKGKQKKEEDGKEGAKKERRRKKREKEEKRAVTEQGGRGGQSSLGAAGGQHAPGATLGTGGGAKIGCFILTKVTIEWVPC